MARQLYVHASVFFLHVLDRYQRKVNPDPKSLKKILKTTSKSNVVNVHMRLSEGGHLNLEERLME